eukprot:6788791-Pyramimonas_sp.AAC.1
MGSSSAADSSVLQRVGAPCLHWARAGLVSAVAVRTASKMVEFTSVRRLPRVPGSIARGGHVRPCFHRAVPQDDARARGGDR